MTGPEQTTPVPRVLRAPEDTRNWTPVRNPDGWRDEAGVVWVRARNDETPEILVEFPRHRGLSPAALIRATESGNVKRSIRKMRREKHELKKRRIEL